MDNKHKKIRVLFVCKSRITSYGIAFGLINSARFLANALNKAGIEAKAVEVTNHNQIDHEVWDYKPTHVMLEALWITPKKVEELVKKYHKKHWMVRIHSKLPFLANEGIAFKWLWDYKAVAEKHHNFKISANNAQMAHELSKLMSTEIVYSPNIYEPGIEAPVVDKNEKNIINIGCFGALRPLKNHLLQAVAAIDFANDVEKELHFHINSGRVEQHGQPVLENLRALFKDEAKHKLIEHGWLNHRDFLGLVAQMDLFMQCSLSESFNICCADAIFTSVPVVVSKEIDWLPFETQADASNVESIVNKLHLNWKLNHLIVTELNKLALKNYNFKSTQEWEKILFGC